MTKKKSNSLQVLSQILDNPEEEQEGVLSIVRTHPLIAGGDAVNSLTKEQEIFLIAKLYGSTDKSAAEASGMSYGGAQQWKKKDDFKKLYDQVVSSPVLMAANSVAFASAKAINVLITLLDHKSVEVVQWAIGQLLTLSRVSVERKEVNVTHEFDFDGALDQLERARQRREISGASEV